MKIIILYPKLFQTDIITIAGIAQFGSPSQSIGLIPTKLENNLVFQTSGDR